MKKVLITGSSGFIGKHLTEEMEKNGYDVIRCDLEETENTVAMDILNTEQVLEVIKEYHPDLLINMAGQANVSLSWKEPQLTVQTNTIGLINLLEAVKTVNPSMRVIAVGSADEYGKLGPLGTNVTEDILLKPATPYAISKQAQEQFAQLYAQTYGMDVCMIRIFNLGGTGQAKGYVISDFASGVAEIESGKKEYLSVGNLESSRDFTHVKDACKAVRLIAEKGQRGEIYNICSGAMYPVQEVLDRLVAMAKTEITIRRDPEKMRPSDTPGICGNHDKLTSHTGWVPEKALDEILADALEYWRGQYTK